MKATVSLNNADIIALPSVPITLIPAVAGKIIIPILCTIQTDFATASYGADPDGYIEFNGPSSPILDYIPNDTGNGLTQLDTFLTGNRLYILRPQWDNPGTLLTGWDSVLFRANRANFPSGDLTIDIDNNGAGNLTGGDPANSMKINVIYDLIDV